MANTKVTGDLIASSTIATGNIADNAVTSDKISGITTAHITEGSNLYYTDARARSAVSVSGNALSYNSSTGVITSNFEEAPTFTGIVTASRYVATGQNLSHGTSRLKISQENTTLSEIRFYGADTSTAGALRFMGSSSDGSTGDVRMTIASSGNVGIGTTSPTSKLSIFGSQAAIDITRGNSGDSKWEFSSDSTALYFSEMSTGTRAYMMAIKETTGNVGIGTTSPIDLLTIKGDGKYIASHDGTNYAFRLGADSSGDGNFILYDSSGNVKVKLYGEANAANYINNGGNLGIGTTSPSEKLTVNGNIESLDTFILKNSGGHKYQQLFQNTNDFVIRYNNSSSWFERMRIDSSGNAIFTKSGGAYLQLKDASAVRGAINVETSDGLVFTTGSSFTERMRIDSSGRVGIGTTSPSGELHVFSSGNADAYFQRNSGARGHIQAQADKLVFGTTNNKQLDFKTNEGVRMSINTSGNVGIGTTSTSEKLHVVDTSAGVVRAPLRLQNEGTTTGTGVELYLTTKTSSGGNTTSIVRSISTDTSGNCDMVLLTPYQGSASEKMRITSSGNVGIGTTSPDAKLEVKGNFKIERTSIAEASEITMEAGEFDIKAHSAYKMRFFTGGSERMRINDDGQLGSTVYKASGGNADTLYTTLNHEIGGHNGNGMKYLGHLNIRDGSRYLDVALNTSANNIMFYIYVKGYLYNRGMYISCKGGYTYQGNIINVFGADILDSGISKDLNVYRGTNSTAGNYSGYLCFRIDSGSNGYSEGMIEIYLGTHSTTFQNAVKIHSYAQNDTSNNYFAQ